MTKLTLEEKLKARQELKSFIESRIDNNGEIEVCQWEEIFNYLKIHYEKVDY